MSKFFDILTIGGAVRDVTFYTDQGKIFDTPENLTAQKMLGFEYGAKINIKEVYCTLGGGAANTAVSFSHLGFKTGILTRIGEDSDGHQIISKLGKEDIDFTFIQKDKRIPTGFSFIIATDKKEKEHIAFLYRGANENLEFNPKDLSKIKVSWIYLTSLSGKNWFKTLKNIFQFVKFKKAKIVWNPGNLQLQAGKKVLSNFLKATDVLILNKDEAIELVLSGIKLGSRNPKFVNKPAYLLNILNEWGPKIVVITDGKRGAWAYAKEKIYNIKALRVKEFNTTGVGDAFGSAFLGGFINSGGDVKQALKWGIINSGSVLGKIGAQAGLLKKKELLKKNY